MPKDYDIADISAALEGRDHPTIMAWNRLEGRPRRANFARALKAEVHDAMFMLTRQWQMGEFRSDDAGVGEGPSRAQLRCCVVMLERDFKVRCHIGAVTGGAHEPQQV